ncbi:MFS transporter [Serinicoccus sediminis]|uniref:MFS transporter n=1 Tax=Serinicoccus sediminis TaxID=2306021 RepID=UPI001020BD54|nr:MFS transporter [Serinicoccus sediminis]
MTRADKVRGVRSRPGARTPGGFYGWHVTAFAAVVLVATGPGQTVGVSTFVDPMIADLGVDRATISTAYLVGTLTGALVLPRIGRLVDHFGARRCMLVIGAAFGAVLVAMSLIGGLLGLLLGFMGIRSLGQGALGLTATTVAAHWFDRHRGRALGLVSAVGSAGIALVPLAAELLISTQGWRVAWVVLGLLVWLIVLPVAGWGIRDDPAQLSQLPDGDRPERDSPTPPRWGMTRRQAFAHPYFWVLTAGVAVSGLLTTAVAFHQFSILGERGLSSAAAAANFLPQTVAGLLATLLVGHLIDRVDVRVVVALSMGLHSAALVGLTFVSPGWSAVAFGVTIGAASAAIRITEAAAVPACFGLLHLGAIRGFVASVGVGSTAFGPLLFALGHDLTGSYRVVVLLCALMPLAVAAAGVVLHPPAPVSAKTDQPQH